jgi:hypothetical protein
MPVAPFENVLAFDITTRINVANHEERQAMENFAEVDVLVDDAAELAAEAVCACGCGMGFCIWPFPTLPSDTSTN